MGAAEGLVLAVMVVLLYALSTPLRHRLARGIARPFFGRRGTARLGVVVGLGRRHGETFAREDSDGG
jgi:hypothetical protein